MSDKAAEIKMGLEKERSGEREREVLRKREVEREIKRDLEKERSGERD